MLYYVEQLNVRLVVTDGFDEQELLLIGRIQIYHIYRDIHLEMLIQCKTCQRNINKKIHMEITARLKDMLGRNFEINMLLTAPPLVAIPI